MIKPRPNRELVLVALANLGGQSEAIHTEDIAIECHRLYPDSFSWIKYPDLPDKDTVRVALTDARKEKYGALIKGRVGRSKLDRDGWQLTEAGNRWLSENRTRMQSEKESAGLKEHRQKLLRRLKRIRDHRLFAEYRDSPSQFTPSIGDIADLLRCRVDAEPEVWSKRFANTFVQAQVAAQQDVEDFLARCEAAYLEQR